MATAFRCRFDSLRSVCKFPLQTQILRAFSVSTSKGDSKDSFFGRLTGAPSIERATDAHSKVLTGKETLYELDVQHVKPECIEDYISLVGESLPRISKDSQFPGQLVGSWTTMFGRLDQAIHLWMFTGGYSAVVEAKQYIRENPEYLKFARERRHMMYNRENQLLHEFSFWGEPSPRTDPHIYELRTYHLKPGTLIEWGNNWGRAIKLRQKDNEAVGGFFSQIGELYMVHHIWAYKDLVKRKEIRENLWNYAGWDDCVANTVPLIRRMESRVMVPLPFSPTK
ncbi:protein NipSnap homolog 1 [Exaiptasia diaphana]|uniref:NIPSNAP domain-containing protein n=1 Tax=Exaiptasia diaphana TaxID=2652724 RepID=A0A913XXR2_EXADI|nr:protein NipSnap homolog 1 [Exaiptasia diaphana]KXJ08543.1 Protein NipSnap-like 1 [Exaiptasia diaphana]